MNTINTFKALLASVICGLAFTTTATAQTIKEGPLPIPLINEECVMGDDPYFGWDGQRSCNPSNIWIYGANYPLSRTSSDVNGDNLAWDRSDFLNKTVRCDVFTRHFQATSGYEIDIVDISFLDADSPNVDPAVARLPVADSHIYSSGWRISYGRLKGVLLDFNSREISTEKGYIFIYDSGANWREPDKEIATHFGHCYLRDESEPLRASKYCVDYDGDGIGWNGSESCSVQVVDPGCDYSQASAGSNLGWGYNPETGRSCPPIGTTAHEPEDKCSVSRDSGWGWNYYRQEACFED